MSETVGKLRILAKVLAEDEGGYLLTGIAQLDEPLADDVRSCDPRLFERHGAYSDSKWSCSTVTLPKNRVEAPCRRSMRW